MIAGHDTTRENLTLSEADLAACRFPVVMEKFLTLRGGRAGLSEGP